jgi:hypothetical protein
MDNLTKKENFSRFSKGFFFIVLSGHSLSPLDKHDSYQNHETGIFYFIWWIIEKILSSIIFRTIFFEKWKYFRISLRFSCRTHFFHTLRCTCPLRPPLHCTIVVINFSEVIVFGGEPKQRGWNPRNCSSFFEHFYRAEFIITPYTQ